MLCNVDIPTTGDARPGKPLQLITTCCKLASNQFTLPWTPTLPSTDVLWIALTRIFFSRSARCKISTMFSNE